MTPGGADGARDGADGASGASALQPQTGRDERACSAGGGVRADARRGADAGADGDEGDESDDDDNGGGGGAGLAGASPAASSSGGAAVTRAIAALPLTSAEGVHSFAARSRRAQRAAAETVAAGARSDVALRRWILVLGGRHICCCSLSALRAFAFFVCL